MKPLEYNEIMPRVAIENLKLIEYADLVNLVGKDLEAIRCALAETSYGENVSMIPKNDFNSSALEEVLLQNYVETFEKIVKFSSENIKNLLLAVLKRFEVLNVKTMFRALKAKITVDEAMKHIIPVGRLDKARCKAILSGSKSIEDLANALSDFEYGLILKNAMAENKEITDGWLLEVALDKAVYSSIFDAIEQFKGVDKKIAKDVFGIEVDAINVSVILKCKGLMISQDTIKDYLLPTALIDEETLDKAINAATVQSALESVINCLGKKNLVYHNLFSQLLKECNAPLSRLEAILDKASLKMSLYMLKKHMRYYNVGFVLAFLKLKWIEVKNLICLINGSERRRPSNQIKKLLILPDEW
jgi:vacuolar-type H+-ATPase subunit C/Vma6